MKKIVYLFVMSFLACACGGDDSDSPIDNSKDSETQEQVLVGKSFSANQVRTQNSTLKTDHEELDNFKKIRGYGDRLVWAKGEATETEVDTTMVLVPYWTDLYTLLFDDKTNCRIVKSFKVHCKKYTCTKHDYKFQFEPSPFSVGSGSNIELLNYQFYRYQDYSFKLSIVYPYCYIFQYFSNINMIEEYENDGKDITTDSLTYTLIGNDSIEFRRKNVRLVGAYKNGKIKMKYDGEEMYFREK